MCEQMVPVEQIKQECISKKSGVPLTVCGHNNLVVLADKQCSGTVTLRVGYETAGTRCVHYMNLYLALRNPILLWREGSVPIVFSPVSEGGDFQFLDPTALTCLFKERKLCFMGCDFIQSLGFT